ncbi:hypothetical protein M758_1G098300 [Ceratodon purpureus]|nr:hypothetical protein M758_1G098300 [Ceratodon purpureus]
MNRQVPWESWQQWHHVRYCFFSNVPAQIAQALDRVAAWQSRGGLPVAVEITAELISVQQRDPYMNTEVSPGVALPGEMLRMMYAMAIMRLVNGVVDQSVRRNSSSVANRAEDAHLPRAFVDIRHETSHNELPSLPLVRHASKQALAWLLRNYWEEQELLLPNTQGTLKTRLLEHAQVIFEILVTQQKLLSKETKGQDYKQQRLTLKRALKGIKRQQQALLRELLELTHSGSSELISLLVEEGLLAHDLNPSCSSPAPNNKSQDDRNSSDFEEVPDSPTSSDGFSITMRQEDKSVAAWKHTCVQLAEHMPQLPALLLSSIVKTLIAMPSESNSKTELVTPISKEELVEWATWILDQSSALSKKAKAQTGLPKFIETGANVQMQAVFPQDALKELAHLCMRSRIDRESLVKLVSHLSPLVNDSSFRRHAELLARCALPCSNFSYPKDLGVEESERDSVVRQRKSDSIQNGADGELSLDSALVKARELQQTSVAKYLAELKCINSMESTVTAGPWSKAKSWTSCAIGMLPSAFGHESIIPQFDLKPELVHTGKESESACDVRSTEINLSSLSTDQGNGQDLKRKALEVEAEVVDLKRMRVEDQPMGEETKTASDENQDETLETVIDEMDEDQALVDGADDDDGADKFDGSMDYTMEPKRSLEVTTVTWQGYLLQRGVLQLGGLQELPNLQTAIRVL